MTAAGPGSTATGSGEHRRDLDDVARAQHPPLTRAVIEESVLPYRRRPMWTAVTTVATVVAATLTLGATPALASSDVPTSATYSPLPAPVYTGDANPVPTEPAPFTADGMMKAMYDADAANGGTDFWMDRLLARRGAEPARGDSQNVLMTRGRAAFLKAWNPAALGFGGQLAYYDTLGSGADALTVDLGSTYTEDVSKRVQMPSHDIGVYTNGSGQTATATRYITHDNVVVEQLTIASTTATTVPVTVTSPLTTTVDGDELTGQLKAYNDLTTVFPRLSGDDLTPSAGALKGTLTVPAGGSVTTKFQLGLVTDEIPASRTEYDAYRADTPAAAYADQVRTYNKWWADNIPYIDVPDANLKKAIYYRWWILRYNFLDADMPGNNFQFPTSIEGVQGYNNAIALTVPMFSQDLKYLRTADASYGSWLSEGEVSAGDAYTDNPGDPANWSNFYTQYTTQSALQSWQLHGGPTSILAKLAQYGDGDVRGQLSKFDKTGENLLTYDNPALTGNDADAVSFDYRPGVPEQRPETAYVYANAMAAAQAYDLSGNTAKGDQMRAIAQNVKTAMNTKMWDATTRQYKSRYPDTGELNPWREINNYLPYTVGLAPDDAAHREAFRFWDDPSQFSVFPMYTANQQDKAEATAKGRPGSNNFSHINSVIQFNLLASALRKYPSQYLTAATLKDAIEWAGWANFIGGDNRYPDSNEFWANWNPNTKQIDYRSFIHQTQLGATNYPIIEDVAGLQSRSDDKIQVAPIDIGYDHFAVTDLDYRGSDLSIVWDEDGGHYGSMPKGYSLVVDGKVVATSSKLTGLVYDPATGTVTADDPTAVITNTATSDVVAPADRTIADAPTLQTLQKAGIDATATGSATNLATTATASASYSAPGFGPAGANDGVTTVRPYWSDKGSGNAKDWYQLTFPSATRIDDLKLYFYDNEPAGGHDAPVQYQVQALSGGTWTDVGGQFHSPTYPIANYNHVQFPAVTATAFRVLVTNPSGSAVGLREVQAFDTGVTAPTATNAAPRVTAAVAAGSPSGLDATLVGTVADDGRPGGTVTSRWSKVSGPGDVLIKTPAATGTDVRVSEAGDYVFRLTASDGAETSTADVAVTFAADAGGQNIAPQATASASYTSPWEKVSAINNGIDPTTSNPGTTGVGWGTYPQSTGQYAQLDWAKPVRLDAASAYFYDNAGGANGPDVSGVVLPQTWKVQYWDGTSFVDVKNPSGYPIADDKYNDVTFDAVTTTKLRYVLDLEAPNPGAARGVGLRQVKAIADAPSSITAPHVPTVQGAVPTLPATVDAVYANGARTQLPVQWDTIDPSQVATGGTSFTVNGAVSGSDKLVKATVYVRINSAVTVTNLVPATVQTPVGVAPQLPPTVDAIFNDGSRDNVSTTVTWDAIDPASYASANTFDVTGTVAGTTLKAKATITVGTGSAPDRTAPTTTATTAPLADGSAGWWKTRPVSVSLSATDTGGSTVAATVYSLDGGTTTPYTAPISVTTDGKHTVSFHSTDAAGNVETSRSITVDVDTVAPATQVSGLPADGSTVRSAVTATATASDATSGVKTLQYRLDGGDWTTYAKAVRISAAGQHAFSVRATDVAGNVSETRSTTFTVRPVGTTATLSLTSARAANAAGWYRTPVSFLVTAPKGSDTVAQYRVDGRPWVTAGRSRVVLRTDAEHVVGTRLLSRSSRVVAGSVTQRVVRIDHAAPRATIVAPDGVVGSPRNPVTLRWSGYDSLSGVAAARTSVNGAKGATVALGDRLVLSRKGTYTVLLRVIDIAGNSRSVRTTVRITADTKPAVRVTPTTVTSRSTPITVRVSGFVRYEQVVLRLGTVRLGTVTTDPQGRAGLTVRVPDSVKAGRYTATATGAKSALRATSPAVLIR